MSKSSDKMTRWKFLDHLLSSCGPISQNGIMKAYQDNPATRLIDKSEYERKSEIKKREALNFRYLATLRKDLYRFKSTLEEIGQSDMLIVGRGAENKLYDEEKDHRTKTFHYKDPNFSIIPYLTDELSDSEYRKLVNAIRKLRGSLSEQTFEDIQFSILSRVEADYGKGLQCVEYEDNRKLKGRQYRPVIYNAITEKHILKIKYKTFRGDKFEFDFHPYLLKQYNERWFAFGLNTEDGNQYFNIPLDRLVSAPLTVGHYEEDIPENYAKHFEKMVGVTRLSGKNIEHIIIKISDIDTWGRATTKPLTSQRTLEEFCIDSGFGTISLDVFPNNELYSKLLSWGKNVEIESPDHIRNEMKDILESIANLYRG